MDAIAFEKMSPRTPPARSAHDVEDEIPKPEKRGRTFSPPQWWIDAMNAAVKEAGGNDRVATQLALEQGLDVDASTVSRAKNGVSTSFEMADALSELFAIPPPIFIAETIEDARAMEGIPLVREKYLAKQVAKAARIAAGVGKKHKQDQGSRVQPEHANSAGGGAGKRRRVGPSRPRTPSR